MIFIGEFKTRYTRKSEVKMYKTKSEDISQVTLQETIKEEVFQEDHHSSVGIKTGRIEDYFESKNLKIV
jgi:hypothetical protein